MKRAAICRTYVPKFFGNSELEGDDQVVVEMGIATMKEKEVFAAVKIKHGGKTELVNKEYLALRKKVTKIDNYFDENDQPIDTADKLIVDMEKGSPESTKLCMELWNHIMGYDTESLAEDGDDTEELTEGEE